MCLKVTNILNLHSSWVKTYWGNARQHFDHNKNTKSMKIITVFFPIWWLLIVSYHYHRFLITFWSWWCIVDTIHCIHWIVLMMLWLRTISKSHSIHENWAHWSKSWIHHNSPLDAWNIDMVKVFLFCDLMLTVTMYCIWILRTNKSPVEMCISISMNQNQAIWILGRLV